MDTFKSLLGSDLPVQTLSYDTTFNLGDFYVSVLIFCETEFVDAPVMALAYLIHERKLQQTHEEFFAHIAQVCPEIGAASNFILVTDQEAAITNAFSKFFPHTRTFLCWNHVLQVTNS